MLGAGAKEEHADAVADVVTRAERDGSHSHGLFRIPGYVASLRSGKVKGDADPTLSKRSRVVLHCDGDLGYPPLAHRRSLTAPPRPIPKKLSRVFCCPLAATKAPASR